jgi:S1-C subfamily serine protease
MQSAESGQDTSHLVFSLVVALLIGTNATAHGQSTSPLLASCAWVRAENDGAGAGFIIDTERKLLVTCRHLVAERTNVDVIFPWFREGEVITDRRTYLANRVQLRKQGLLVTGKVLKTSDELDLALLQLETLPASASAVKLATCPPSPGDTLQVTGNRLDLDTVWNLTTGPVRATGRLSEGYFWRGKKLAANADVVIGQLPIEEGDSGGPVFNDRGELVAMASALRRQCPLMAVAISAAEIRKFVGLTDVPKTKELHRPWEIAESLVKATVWVRPTANDVHLAGVLIEKSLVLTCAKGLTRGDHVGVGFPIREDTRWDGERAAYKDAVGLALQGCWRSGVVLAIDSDRDLALIQLDSSPDFVQPVRLSDRLSLPGDRIHTMNHPSGLEFAWVYAGGVVRQRGGVTLASGENAKRVSTLLCQLPGQAGSPGGPVLNGEGELVGVLAAKESTQMVGYAVTVKEIISFLDVTLIDRSPRTLSGLLVRIEDLPHRVTLTLARGFGKRGEEHRVAGRHSEARIDCDRALSLDPACLTARLCRAKMLDPEAALTELDTTVERASFDRELLLFRAELAVRVNDWRKARGDLERIVYANPLDAEARQQLVGVLLELNEDARAAVAVSDTLRADPKRMSGLSVDLLAQAERLAKKFPDAPSIPVGWLIKALTAAEKAIGDPKGKGHLTDVLKRAAIAKDDKERLVVLREALKTMAGKP